MTRPRPRLATVRQSAGHTEGAAQGRTGPHRAAQGMVPPWPRAVTQAACPVGLILKGPMKLSARNVFPGRVQALVSSTVSAEVTLALAGGDVLVAVISQASARELGLAVGVPASAIVKAPWVWLSGDDAAARAAAGRLDNLLCGTVAELRRGPVQSEVALALPGGSVVHAVISSESLRTLGLEPGSRACAVIKAHQVILAV